LPEFPHLFSTLSSCFDSQVSTQSKTTLWVELSAPTRQVPMWTELGYTAYAIERDIIDACEAEPRSLERVVREQVQGTTDPCALIMACDRLPVARATETSWQHTLHEPLTRCFTVVSALVPWIGAQPHGGHVIALLARSALLPDTAGGSAAVLGRALLGLFESLRAELRQTATRVTICFTDDQECAEAFQERMREVLHDRPFHSLPPSVDRKRLEDYFAPLLASLARAPKGVPLPAGPQGEVYELRSLRDSPLSNP
jgi:hypothetical protein